MKDLKSYLVPCLGEPRLASPLAGSPGGGFVGDEVRILADPHLHAVRASLAAGAEPPSFEVAGPRARIFFEPSRTRAAIATCGGLSPGLNDVIRALVMQLWHRYGVEDILGVQNGFQGLGHAHGGPTLTPLTPQGVSTIHEQGGTILGTSRGTPGTGEIVDTLHREGIQIFFAVGGDGTMRGALEICEEVERRGLELSVVGVPKTIDNDIPFVRRSFGFETAVMVASQAVRAAHTEAMSVRRGVGLVRLMGRHSGYIAASATLATGHANFCLVPEVPFRLEGKGGLLALLEERLARRSHALIVVAEGAGQQYFDGKEQGRDASGNRRLGDIGVLLKERIAEHFSPEPGVTLKYIDPSYLIRAAPANPSDSLFCARLAQCAVHAAMAGKTAMLIGYWHGRLTHLPLSALDHATKTIDPEGELWRNVLEATGQPSRIGDGD